MSLNDALTETQCRIAQNGCERKDFDFDKEIEEINLICQLTILKIYNKNKI